MRMILPSAGDELDLHGLAAAYAYPQARWLRTNFVSSADGAAYIDGRSTGLSSPDDKRIFGILRGPPHAPEFAPRAYASIPLPHPRVAARLASVLKTIDKAIYATYAASPRECVRGPDDSRSG